MKTAPTMVTKNVLMLAAVEIGNIIAIDRLSYSTTSSIISIQY